MIGFKKKKKKIQTHSAYLLGQELCSQFKKLVFKNYFKRILLNLKGYTRFIRAAFSNVFSHVKYTRRFLNKKLNGARKWYSIKRYISNKCTRKHVKFVPTHRQRKTETIILRDLLKGKKQVTRYLMVKYLSSISFSYQKHSEVNMFQGYFRKAFY
jgi:hypothetical protein